MGWCSDKMIATYSHTRLASKMEAFERLEKVLNGSPEPAAATAPAPDIMHPVIQAEIARQVALAMQRERESQKPLAAKVGRVITFPGAG